MAAEQQNILQAESRTDFGKGVARKIRANDKVPAVLYGHGHDPVHLTLPGHQTFLILKASANALVTLQFDGEEQLALVKDVQRHPFRDVIEHVDLLIVRRGEKVTVEVPFHVEGEPLGGNSVQVEHQVLTIEADVLSIPERIEVNVDGLGEGTRITAGELKLPEGTTLTLEDDEPVVFIVEAAAQDTSSDAGEAAAEEAPADAAQSDESE